MVEAARGALPDSGPSYCEVDSMAAESLRNVHNFPRGFLCVSQQLVPVRASAVTSLVIQYMHFDFLVGT